jgi:hypothetical protein
VEMSSRYVARVEDHAAGDPGGYPARAGRYRRWAWRPYPGQMRTPSIRSTTLYPAYEPSSGTGAAEKLCAATGDRSEKTTSGRW